jgi:hypothetical protein
MQLYQKILQLKTLYTRMTNGLQQHTSRIKERIGLIGIAVILLLLFNSLLTVLKRDFTEVPSRVAQGTIVNLNDESPGQRLKRLLF